MHYGIRREVTTLRRVNEMPETDLWAVVYLRHNKVAGQSRNFKST